MVAVEAGQADVQQHQMGVKGGELLHHMPQVLHLPHLQIPKLALGLHRLGDAPVILHHQHPIERMLLHGLTSCVFFPIVADWGPFDKKNRPRETGGGSAQGIIGPGWW